MLIQYLRWLLLSKIDMDPKIWVTMAKIGHFDAY